MQPSPVREATGTSLFPNRPSMRPRVRLILEVPLPYTSCIGREEGDMEAGWGSDGLSDTEPQEDVAPPTPKRQTILLAPCSNHIPGRNLEGIERARSAFVVPFASSCLVVRKAFLTSSMAELASQPGFDLHSWHGYELGHGPRCPVG